MSITGTSGKDVFKFTTTGNGLIDGQAGLDVVSYDGKFSNFTIDYSNNNLSLSDGSNGSDTLVGIEKVLFLGDNKQISLSTESIVNVETSGDQSNTTVTALAGGGYINFWYAKIPVTDPVTNTTTDTYGYYFRKFDANGVATDLGHKIIADTANNMSGFKPAIQSDGSILVTWSAPDADKNGVYVQLFNADGTVKSPPLLANDTLTDNQGSPSIAVLKDDSFVVAWTSANQGDALNSAGSQMGDTPNQAGVFSQHFDKSGNPIGWETKVSDSGGGDATVTALKDGGYMIGHEGIAAGSGEMTIDATYFDSNDVKLPNTIYAVNSTKEDLHAASNPDYNELASKVKLPTAVTLSDGTIAMAWQAPRDAYPSTGSLNVHDDSIIVRLLSSTGDVLTGEIVANTFTTYEQSQPAIAALTNGFVVVWQSMLQDGSYWGVYGQRFNADGSKAGDEFQVNTKTQDSQQHPTVTGLANGGFVISWEAQYQDGNQQGSLQPGTSGTEIVQQRYDQNGNALGQTIAGGNGNDTITVGGTSDIEIDGGAGNDTLTSGSGNDTLRGGTGNDTFDAGIGNNTIIGGDGVDILKLAGKLTDYTITGGNDQYLVGHIAKDANGKVINDANGNPTFDYSDNLSSVEKLQFSDQTLTLIGDQSGGTVGVTLTDLLTDGTKPSNVTDLKGTPGEDFLTAGNIKGASDILEGSDGNDTYTAVGSHLTIYDTGGVNTLKLELSVAKIDLSNPLKNGFLKGLEYIDNVELTGKTNAKLIGNSNNNTLIGNDGNNVITGGAGDDIIYGGLGKDTLTGGDGADTFVFNTSPGKNNADTITDFSGASGDKIRLDPGIFSNLDPNHDGIINFIQGAGRTKADVDTTAFMVYDSQKGNLYYDGAGSSAVLIAKVGIYDVDANGKLTTFHAATLTADNFDYIA